MHLYDDVSVFICVCTLDGNVFRVSVCVWIGVGFLYMFQSELCGLGVDTQVETPQTIPVSTRG